MSHENKPSRPGFETFPRISTHPYTEAALGRAALPPDALGEKYCDAVIEARFPGIKDIFHSLINISHKSEQLHGRLEFPMYAAVAVFDEKRQRWNPVSSSGNQTNRRNPVNGHHDGQSLDHAEIVAMRHSLGNVFDSKHFPDNIMLVSNVEPCIHCASGLLHCLQKDTKATVVYGVSQAQLQGRGVAFATDLEYDEKVHQVISNKVIKPFRHERSGYTAKEFIEARNPNVEVLEYRSAEAFDAIGSFPLSSDRTATGLHLARR